MKRSVFLVMGLIGLSVSVWMPTFAEAPQIPKTVPVDDLVAEANQLIGEAKTATNSAESYKENEDDIRRTAGVLAVLGQAIKEHPEAKSQKLSGTGLRDAALALAKSEGPDDAAKAMKDMEAAQQGVPNMRETAAAWKDLIGMDDLMHVVNTRNAKVRRSARRSRDPEGDSRNALTIAMLSIPMAEQGEDYLSEEAEIKAWKKYAHDFGKGMTELAAAFKAKDKAGIQKHLDFATKACNDCHAQFRDEK